MRRESGNRIRLGVFVSVGLALLIAGIYFIGERHQLFRKTIRINGVFKDVSGLQAGNNVRLSGLTVGTVDNISIASDTTVKVELLVGAAVKQFIRRDVVLMGNKTLIITPGEGKAVEIEDNDTLKTLQPLDLDKMLMSLKNTVDNAAVITRDVSGIMQNIHAGNGTIGRLLMDETDASNLDSTLVNLKQGSTEFRSLVSTASTITEDVSTITNAVASGKGTVGRLLMNERDGRNVDSTLINVKEASADFRKVLEKAGKSWLLWGW